MKSPETPQEFWAAVKHEVEVGNHNRAAAMLKGFWEKVSALGEQEQRPLLLGLHDAEGMAEFLKLSNIPECRKVTSKDPATGKETPVPDLIVSRITQFVGVRLGDTKRIDFFIANLSKSSEERAYAISQLRQSGPRAVPHMINVLRDDTRAKEHDALYTALLEMGHDAVPPLLAAFDAKKPYLQSLLISLFLQRADESTVPYLWHLYAQAEGPEIRKQAGEALAKFLRAPPKERGEPKAVLTREAERFYKHQVEFPAGNQQTIWRWDEKAGLTSQIVTRTQWEEYFGAFWAKKALELDSRYQPAQVIFLSVVIEKAYERGGMEQPLSKTAPELHQLLASTNSSLLEAVLDKALSEGRTAVTLGAARALGPTGDWRLVRSSERGAPPLIRALSYPDRRVQLAAAEAILRIPGTEAFPGSSRVVEVLRRALMSEVPAKALIAYGDSIEGQKLGAMLRQWGYEPIVVSTGREALRAALESADIEAIFVDPRVPHPGLAYLLSQLRLSPDTAGVPIILMTQKDQERSVRPYAERYSRTLVVSPPPVSLELLKVRVEPFLKDPFRVPLTANERKAQAKTALEWLGRLARGEVLGYDWRPAESALYHALANDELAGEAAEVLSHRSGRQAQGALADLVLNPIRPPSIRAGVAQQLRRHIQRHGILLPPKQIESLVNLPAGVEDPALREEAARLAASLQSDTAIAGQRFRSFQPALTPALKPENKK